MTISPLLSLAGTALVPLARDVVEQLTDGLSFDKLLGRGGASNVLGDGGAGGDDAGSDDAATDIAGLGSGEAVEGSSASWASQLDAIRRQPLQELAAFVDRLRQRLAAGGIELSETISLTVGGRGAIQVDGNHPDRAAIEELLASDQQLAATFRQLSQALVNQRDLALGADHADALRLTIDATDFNLAFE